MDDEQSGFRVTYSQLSSAVNPGFWNILTEKKLDLYKLSQAPADIWGYFTNLNTTVNILEVDSTSFNSEFDGQNLYIPFRGKILNTNTLEQFKDFDKSLWVNNEGQALYSQIENGDAISDPSILNKFLILSFADIKKYQYYYWFAFPVPHDLYVFHYQEPESIKEFFEEAQLDKLYRGFAALPPNQKTYFLVDSSDVLISPLGNITNVSKNNSFVYFFAFYDISSSTATPGSQLRNYIALVLHFCPFLKGQKADFLAIRQSRENSRITLENSVIYRLKLPEDQSRYSWVGWERNERNKMGPRFVNMKTSLDPINLADQAVSLNLKLMKWRLLPEINLERIKTTKCLLLGSGTLGCSVARTLLAWGVKNITFVDNSTVSYSNPVRQSLFTFEDSVNVKDKATAAAENLRKIFPNVETNGVNLSIPMPGHPVGESLFQTTVETISKLSDLVQENDVIFLLMDSRESRWLPTLLGSFYNKIVITTALGFDTYLIIRHGSSMESDDLSMEDQEGFKKVPGALLGCYFCNDITAPGNSMKDRSLDQQCTVTRPGTAQIAGALAVELVISLLQHPEGNGAPAFYKVDSHADLSDIEDQTVLGLLPHSIRGFLSSFSHILPVTPKHDKCVACSKPVLQEYEKSGNNFLFEVFNNRKHLEDVAGLTQMISEIDLETALDFDDVDDF